MKTIEKECAVCGNLFSGRADKQYCSGKCRVRSHRQAEVMAELPLDESEPEMEPWEPDLPWLQPPPKPSIVPLQEQDDDEVDIAAIVRTQLAKYDEQEAAAKLAQRQRAEQAQASEVHAVYVEAIETLLEWEGQPLSKAHVQQLLALLLDAREDYKDHPFLSQPTGIARQRLNDLRDAISVVQETDQEAQAAWGFGYKARYELKSKWRKQLRERLLE